MGNHYCLSTALNQTAIGAYNGNLYVLGGCTAGNPCTTDVSTVNYIAIEPAGYLGNENAYSAYALKLQTSFGSSLVYNGYIYEVGGGNGEDSTYVEYAEIGSDDTLVPQSSCPSGWTLFTSNDIWCYNTSRPNRSVLDYRTWLLITDICIYLAEDLAVPLIPQSIMPQ